MHYLDPADDESGLQAIEETYKKDPYLSVDSVDHLYNYYPAQIQRGPSTNSSIRNEYIKLHVNKIGTFCINNGTYNSLKKKIESFYGCEVSNINCTQIVFRPNINTNTHYYFQYERDPRPGLVNMKEVNWFHNKFPNLKLTLGCPFADSMYSGGTEDRRSHYLIPFFDNVGGAIEPDLYDSGITSPEPNAIIPFLDKNVNQGMYLLTGIHDNVGFQCTILLSDKAKQRAIDDDQFRRITIQQQTPWKRSHKKKIPQRMERMHIKREIIRNPKSDIGYEIPSQDIEYNPDEDPLFNAFQ